MIAALFQLNGSRAVVTTLETLLFGVCNKFQGSWVFWTCLGRVPFTIACATDFQAAFTAFSIFAASVSLTCCVCFHLVWLDPSPTSLCRTIDPILGGEFQLLLIPFSFELIVEELVDMFEWDWLGSTALWRHVLGICDAQGEKSTEAGVTHSVFAW